MGQGDLPKTQAGLYDQFVQQFYTWKKNRFLIETEEKKKLNNALARLALKDFQEGGSRFRLPESFISEELGPPDEENSLFYKALQVGLLNRVGIAAESQSQEKVYAFLHATFEEYFAATGVKNRDFFLPRAHKNKPVLDKDTGQPKPYPIFDSQWKQVILLWLGLGKEHVKRNQKEEFIKALLKFRDGCGGFYKYRAYFLAAAGIAEFGECSRADRVVAQIVKWSCDYGDLREGAEAALQQTHRAKAIAALVKLITTLQQTHRAKAIAALVKLITTLQQTHCVKVIAALINFIASTQNDYYAYMLALESLGEIAVGNESAIAALVNFIANSQNEIRNRIQAAESLGKIDPGNETAIAALINFIDCSEFEPFHSMGAGTLGEIAVGNKRAIDALVNLIATSQDEHTYWAAAESLGKIAVGNEGAIAALVNLIDTSQSESTRWLAAYCLGLIDPGNQSAIDALVNLIATLQSESTREQAAYRLGQIDPGNESAIDALVNLIANSENKSTRRQAAYSLGQIDPGNKSALDALVKLIATSEDEFTRMRAAESLERIAVGNKSALDAWVKIITSCPDKSNPRKPPASFIPINFLIRSLALYSLGNILPADQILKIALVLSSDLKPKPEYYRAISHCAQNMHYSVFYQAWHHRFYMRLAIKFVQRYLWYITSFALIIALYVKIVANFVVFISYSIITDFKSVVLEKHLFLLFLILNWLLSFASGIASGFLFIKLTSILSNISHWQIIIAHCNRTRILRIIQKGGASHEGKNIR